VSAFTRQSVLPRSALLVLLALALLTPRLAPAFAWAIDGHRGVLLCTGSGLVRITVDEQGRPVLPEGDAARHCDLVGTPPCAVLHRWQALGAQQLATRVRMTSDHRLSEPVPRVMSALGARGPPLPG